MNSENRAAFITAIAEDKSPSVSDLLTKDPGLLAAIDEGMFPWGMPPLAAARSRAMADVLMEAGAKLRGVQKWWASGFGVEHVEAHVAEYLVEKGAKLSPHAAAGMGLIDHLRAILDAKPKSVHAKGGDGCRPLHFAREVSVAKLLLDRGADIDARDSDHESTAAQWRIEDAPEVTRFLLDRGAVADLFMAAALDDLELARKLIEDDPRCTTHRIGNNKGPFPGIGFQGRGGTIYQWSLGFNHSPHEIAFKRGHREVFEFLLDKTPSGPRLLVACMLGDRKTAESIAAEHPGFISEFDDEDLALLAKCCWETNLNIDAVRLMLDLGFPVDVPEKNHGFMALHNAAWCGRPDLVELLLEHNHPVDRRDPDHKGTALGFAIHSCTEAKRHPDGEFGKVTELLLKAGVPFDTKYYPVGDEKIDAVLKRHFGL